MDDLLKRMRNYSDSLAPPMAKGIIRDAKRALEAANARIVELEEITKAPCGTNAQILMERKLTCEQIDGAMAFGYQNTNPPPNDDHWLAPFWKIGRQHGDLESQLTAKTELATLYAASLRKVEWEVDDLKHDNASMLDSLTKESTARCDAEDRIASLEAQIATANVREPVAWRLRERDGSYNYIDCEIQPSQLDLEHAAATGAAFEPLFTAPQPTPSAIEAWSALIANSLLGQQKKEDVEEVERLIYELWG